jgi:7,8-dihydropterin-6-yl-methyl-4-(beta-D-ribofuranosyl)aminobenzene 5'-phosphate synthase
MLSAMIATLTGGAKPVQAQAISGSVPEIDQTAVRIVVDSCQFAIAPSRKAPNVEIDHFGWGISANKRSGRTLISEFGLSMHVESRRGPETRNLLRISATPQRLWSTTSIFWALIPVRSTPSC